MTDPKRWIDGEGSSLLGTLSRAGADERPASSAKHRARAAVLLAAAGGAASATVANSAAASTASTVATISAPPVSLASSGAATGGAVATGTAASSVAGGAVATGVASLSAKFGASSVLVGLIAKWTGITAVVGAVGFGGYELAASGIGPRLTESTPTSQDANLSLPSASSQPTHQKFTPPALENLQQSTPTTLGPARGSSPSVALVSPEERSRASGHRSTTVNEAGPDPQRLHPQPAKRYSATNEQPRAALDQELVLVDRAWAAVRAGRSREALRLLDTRTAAGGQFETEALMIRMEALTQSGQHGAARALATQLLTQHATGPLADKARRTLSSSAAPSR